MRNDVISIARSADAEEDWHCLGPRTRTNILRELSRAVFGTAETSGLADEMRAFKRWMVVGGSFGLALQIISTFQLQQPIKHAIVLLFGGQ